MEFGGMSRMNRMDRRYIEYSRCTYEEISSSKEIKIIWRLDLLKLYHKWGGPSKYGHKIVGWRIFAHVIPHLEHPINLRSNATRTRS